MSNKLASQIESAMWFLCVYKIESSVARVNVLCESYYGMAYKLQWDVVAVQISWQNANLSLILKKLMRCYIVAVQCYMQRYAAFWGFSLSVCNCIDIKVMKTQNRQQKLKALKME